MKLKIRGQLILSITSIVVIFSLVVGALFLFLFSRITTQLYRSELTTRTTAVADNLNRLLTQESGTAGGESGGLGLGQGRGENFGKHSNFLRFITDASGAELWIVNQDGSAFTTIPDDTSEDQSDLTDDGRTVLAAVFAGSCTSGVETREDDDLFIPTITVGSPVYGADGALTAAVIMAIQPTGIVDLVRSGGEVLLFSMGAALALSVLIAALMARHFTRPLREMEAVTRRLADGDYSAHTDIARRDEIGSLAAHIDTLALRLDEASRESARLEQMRQDYIVNISHELRTPVTVLRGSLEALRDGVVRDPDKVAAYYAELYDESVHLERMVNDLLELTRLQNLDYPISMAPLNLPDVLSDALRAARKLAAPKGITLVCEDPAPVFPCEGDYQRLRQLFLIILDNGVKFSPEGGAITVTSRVTAEGLTIAIADSGCGIAPDILPHIFERFIHNTDPINAKGTGLGLAIAKGIADRHGFVLQAESAVGAGATFTVIAPAETELGPGDGGADEGPPA